MASEAGAERRDQDTPGKPERSYGPVAEFGAKLRYLRDTVRRPDGRRYTQQQIAHYVAEQTGRPCDRAYISALEKGDKPAPMADKIAAIAAFFDVPAGYFFGDEYSSQAIAEQIELVRAVAHASGDKTRLAALRLIATVDAQDLARVSRAIQSALADKPSEPPQHGPQPGIYHP